MIPLSLAEIAEVTDGTLSDVEDPDSILVSGPVTLDSRLVEPGGLFVAFLGERVDGHEFAAAAVGAGAAAVLGSRPTGVPAALVADPQAALGALATHLLNRLTQPPGRLEVVAITGSQGKTSTKDLMAQVLGDRRPTVATAGSFNNEIGLPLTVLRAQSDTRYLVLEMGTRGPGHLRTLCRIAPPTISVVLNVGKAHLSEFGTQEAIAEGKGEVVEALPETGLAVLNADDPRVLAMSRRTRARVVRFGTADSAELSVGDLRLDAAGRPRFTLTWEGATVEVRLGLVGAHQATNAAAAAAVALAVGADLSEVAASLGSARQLSRWRMEVGRNAAGVTVLNDAYNANPDSMAAGLRALMAMGLGEPETRHIAVIGEMRELGESATEEHREVGRLAHELGVDVVLGVGDWGRHVQQGAREAGQPEEASIVVADNAAALAWLETDLRAGDVVLVKASRAAGLETVALSLLGPTP